MKDKLGRNFIFRQVVSVRPGAFGVADFEFGQTLGCLLICNLLVNVPESHIEAKQGGFENQVLLFSVDYFIK